MGENENRTPWFVTAIVSILVALIGAYAVIESNQNSSPVKQEGNISEYGDEKVSFQKESSFDDLSGNENPVGTLSPSQMFVGKWEADVAENDIPFKIRATFKSDGTFYSQYIAEYSSSSNNGFWQFTDNTLFQQFSNGSNGKARIKWLTNDKFELTIIDNGVPDDAGNIRVFERKY